MSGTTIHVRTKVHALFFVGDLPLSDEQIGNLGPVCQVSMDAILLRDVADAIGAAADAMRPFEIEGQA